MAVLKHVLISDAFCASTVPTRTDLKPTRYLATRLVAQITASTSSVAMFALNSALGKQVTPAKESTTTVLP